jgi:hypothetical protein
MAEAITMKNAPKEWKNMEDFSGGIDTNRLPATKELAGKRFVFNGDGKTAILDLKQDECEWEFNGKSGKAPYEAILLCDDTYFVDFVSNSEVGETLTLFVNVKTYRAALMHLWINLDPKPGETMVQHEGYCGVVDGGIPTGDPVEYTRDLIGEIAVYRYSPNHLYEHYYINSKNFVWHCLVGEQRGMGAMEPAKYIRFQDNNYIIAWRELLIPTGTVFFIDFNNNRETGKFVGIHSTGKIVNEPGGAHVQQICKHWYPVPNAPV